ncbi:hypothetical protein BGZ63DRAFT_354616 [Mariannaea sp. PMI_226]|nr:hypothetical protein BGZ63DRAFT_354616 [Mariannaea sp. PMI_226]
MSGKESGKNDAQESAKRYTAPYSAGHPIPTVSKYREERAARQEEALNNNIDSSGDREDVVKPSNTGQANVPNQPKPVPVPRDDLNEKPAGAALDTPTDTSQVGPVSAGPKQNRKQAKKHGKERAEREVTDPVTHLPVIIQDFTDKQLKEIDLDGLAFGNKNRTSSGLGSAGKSHEQLTEEKHSLQQGHDAMVSLFPPPSFDALRLELAIISKRGITFGLTGIALILALTFSIQLLLSRRGQPEEHSASLHAVGLLLLVTASGGAIWLFITFIQEWTAKKIHNVFQDGVWDAHKQQTIKASKDHNTETTVWLNSLLQSVWPLINPDLFTSLSDTLEDIMQASLPRFVRMVSVEDIGQGSEALRILGVRWLPTGAATRAVSEKGELLSEDQSEKENETQNQDDADGQGPLLKGLLAEEGDFVNLEIAFAYRTRSDSTSFKERTKDMHLYLAFYLPGNIKIPVWVDLEGIVGTLRMRLQLTPDPPFFALCTATFLGQPKVNLSCVPLNRHAFNIMDIPFISNFVQSSVDAAMAEYVAPKSLTLDLKDILAGDDFKKDTAAVGVLVVRIKRGYDFKIGDAGVPLIKSGSSDPYVSVGWAKFGKVVWTTRVLENEMEPSWEETCFVLVTPQELNSHERIRLQLWDSDRLTADDDLGRIEVSLKSLMTSEESNNKMQDRSDGFQALKPGDGMPGKLDWSVGYFSKTRLLPCQISQQTHDVEVRSMEQLKEKVKNVSERKLREAMLKEGKEGCGGVDELEQQKTQMFESEQNAMIISAPPPEEHPSGIFSIQIHNITGLEIERLNRRETAGNGEESDEEEAGEGLPSSYCTIILNHRKTYKTRTKPQNAKPFFNASCERFIRNWKDGEVIVAVRDARLHEDDPLLGIIHLPLEDVFRKRSQVVGFYPLTGGIGRGRIRLSMVWRSVQLQMPQKLLGWNYGTVEVGAVASVINCPNELRCPKIKFRTHISVGKMFATNDDVAGDGGDPNTATWCTKRGRNLALAVQNRHNSCLTIAFLDRGLLGEDIESFAVLWLKDLIDNEEMELEIPVWKGNFRRAAACCLEDCGEKLATIKLKVTFWCGLGSAHSRWASHDQSLRDVVEIIETTRDNLETHSQQQEAGIVTSDSESGSNRSNGCPVAPPSIGSNSDSSSSSSSDSDPDSGHEIPDGSSRNRQGPIDQLRDYKRRDRRLHRQHRGLMQWKVCRTYSLSPL